MFCIITHKPNLTVGIIPSLNVAVGLLGFFFVKSWTSFLTKFGFEVTPFSRQENTVIQTCVVACYGLAFSGGFGSYLIAMDEKSYKLIGPDYPGNRVENVKNPTLGWMIGFMFVVSFLGLFSLVPLRKVMVIDYKLTYPGGTATTMLINIFHTNTGDELAGFYFDFSPTYVGCGLICSHIVNCSVPLRAIISWGFLWPVINTHDGDWYPADLGSNDFKGLYGYKVFIAISSILGDGLYNHVKIIAVTIKEMYNNRRKQSHSVVHKFKVGKYTTTKSTVLNSGRN